MRAKPLYSKPSTASLLLYECELPEPPTRPLTTGILSAAELAQHREAARLYREAEAAKQAEAANQAEEPEVVLDPEHLRETEQIIRETEEILEEIGRAAQQPSPCPEASDSDVEVCPSFGISDASASVTALHAGVWMEILTP